MDSWVKGTGQVAIVNDPVKGKVMQFTQAGTISLSSQQAYGSFYQDMNKALTADVWDWIFIGSTYSVYNNTRQNGYVLRWSSDNKFYLYKITAGILSSALITTSSTYANALWFKIEITRTLSGLFTLYINNISVGTVTDNTFTTSSYITEDAKVNDLLFNQVLKDGIKQL